MAGYCRKIAITLQRGRLSSRTPGDPRCGSKVWQALDRELSESGKHCGQIVTNLEFQPAAAFNHRKNRRDLRSRQRASYMDPPPTKSYGTRQVLRQVIVEHHQLQLIPRMRVSQGAFLDLHHAGENHLFGIRAYDLRTHLGFVIALHSCHAMCAGSESIANGLLTVDR